MTLNPFAAFNRWWESWRQTRPRLALADKTFDQSHTWHAVFCAIAGVFTWVALGWWLGPRAWALGVLAAIAAYAVYELAWRIRVARRVWSAEPLRWWDGALDVGKPLWAPGCLALAVLFGDVPTWIVGVFAALTVAIAYAYTFGRPSGALFYDGTY